MRRAFLAITGLAASTTALVVLKGSPEATQVAQNLPSGQPVNPAGPGADPSAEPAADPVAAASTPSAAPGAPSSPTPTKTTTARPSGTKTTTKAPSAPRTTTKAPQSTTRRVTGAGFDAKDGSETYGYVQVQIVVSGNRIVDAVALSLPSGGESDIHSGDVRSSYDGSGGEVVRKQNANLNTVSGATATSNAYKQSLRAAIEQAF
ncbi:FMN-binding protein [Micromonospora sp. WMMD710]|uniref:FMN-binding protein n=1 Tax=Micromonospora sp. WMMD710 TaxID=3016085 RepID=UPI002415D2A7|nr:FMN-binding protein [Micromonospora sp. WMMD710]MDG4756743.1 FMN-binding protein [Micromonospora sp. WMMD710]